MKKNYINRFEKLRTRRFDEGLQRTILSESFYDIRIPQSVRYALESMKEIDPDYTMNTYVASENIRKNLTNGLGSKGLSVEYRHQGSVETNTHIKLHSDIDVLVFTNKFHDLQPPLIVTNYYQGDYMADLRDLRQKCYDVLSSTYNQVDNSSSTAIQVFPTRPKRKVEVVVSNWLNTQEYQSCSDEKYRGIYIYNKDTHSRKQDYPFLHISKVREKDSLVNGGVRKLTRMLKTLKADADVEIKLSSFEILCLVFDMANLSLSKHKTQELLLLNEGSNQLAKLINDSNYRSNLRSCNGKELVFGSDESKVTELKKLKLELDDLIEDIQEELGRSYRRIDEGIIYA